MTIAHYHHIYADGVWRLGLREHLSALEFSGLRENISHFSVGIVGAPESRSEVIAGLPKDVEVLEGTGWEDFTLAALHSFAQDPRRSGSLQSLQGRCQQLHAQ